jgi:hypothetical protein
VVETALKVAAMKPVRLLIALAVLGAAGIGLWWSNRDEKAKEGKPATDAPPRILEIKPDQVKQIELKQRGEDKPVIVRFNDKGKWDITSPTPFPADPAAVAAITSGAEKLESERLVDANASDLPSYGLAPALLEVAFTDKAGKRTNLLIGENTPTGNAVYAKLEGDPRLFTLASGRKTAFEKQVNDLREKRLLSFTQDRLTKMELTSRGQTFEISRPLEGDWQITKPKQMRADNLPVDDLINKLRAAQMDLTGNIEGAKAEALFNAGTLVGKVILTDEGPAKTLEVRKNKDGFYAKSSTVAGAYKTSKDTADALDKTADAYRNKKLFDFGFADPTRIEVTDSGKASAFDKAGEKWSSAGKTMDNTSVQQFIDKLRDLSGARFVETGFTTPAVTVSVISNQGKRKEKVEIAQAGANFIARHNDDSSLYELDAKTVDELRKSAGDVREAMPGKKK